MTRRTAMPKKSGYITRLVFDYLRMTKNSLTLSADFENKFTVGAQPPSLRAASGDVGYGVIRQREARVRRPGLEWHGRCALERLGLRTAQVREDLARLTSRRRESTPSTEIGSASWWSNAKLSSRQQLVFHRCGFSILLQFLHRLRQWAARQACLCALGCNRLATFPERQLRGCGQTGKHRTEERPATGNEAWRVVWQGR